VSETPKCLLVRPYGKSVPCAADRSIERFKRAHKRFKWLTATDTEATAAIFKIRSSAGSEFVCTDFDCMVMIDDDVECHWPDIEYLAEQSLTLDGGRGAIVGAVVSKRMAKNGWGVRISDGEKHELYSDELVELGPHRYIGGAFTAYPKSVFLSIIRTKKPNGEPLIPYCPGQGLWPFFIPTMVQNPEFGNQWELLNEDWAICHYARLAGHRVFAAMRPVTIHYGNCGYTALAGVGEETLAE